MYNAKLLFLVLLFGLSIVQLDAQSSNLQKANKFYELYSYGEAIKLYNIALKDNPKDYNAIANLANSYKQLNLLESASKWYSRIPADERSSQDLFNYASTLKSLEQFEKAKRIYLEYAKSDTDIGRHYATSCDFAIRNKKVGYSDFEVKQETIVNSAASDFSPAMFKNKLLISSFRNESAAMATNANTNNQLYVASRNLKNQFSRPALLKKGIQKSMNTGHMTFDEFYTKVAFTKNNNNLHNGMLPLDGNGVKLDIYFAKVIDEGSWDEQTAFDYNSAEASNGFPHLSLDGNTLYFASNRMGGYGGYDIYVSYKNGKIWSFPENLGAEINSPGNEISPFMDEGILYFASDWHTGFGGMDIFHSEKQAGSLWGKVRNMGPKVNSSQNDYSLIYYSQDNAGYFVSDRTGGKGKSDIYNLSKKITTEHVNIFVFEADGKKPVQNAAIDLTACGFGKYNTGELGVITITGQEAFGCQAIIQRAGFYSEIAELIPNNSNGDVEVFLKVRNPNSEEGKQAIAVSTPQPPVNLHKAEPVKVEVLPQPEDEDFLEQRGLVARSPEQMKASEASVVSINKDALKLNAEMPQSRYLEAVRDIKQGKEIFEIQIGAFSKPDFKKLGGLGDLGLVYSDRKNNLYYYKVGTFKSKSEAQTALKKIKTRGYKDAFIKKIKDFNPIVTAINNISEQDQPTITSQPVITSQPAARPSVQYKAPVNNDPNYVPKQRKPLSPKTTVTSSPVVREAAVYKVQLGAFGKSSVITFSPKINALGQVYSTTNGNGMVLYLLGDFNTIEAAKSAQKIAKKEGAPSAFVVAYRGGVKISLEAAKK